MDDEAINLESFLQQRDQSDKDWYSLEADEAARESGRESWGARDSRWEDQSNAARAERSRIAREKRRGRKWKPADGHYLRKVSYKSVENRV